MSEQRQIADEAREALEAAVRLWVEQWPEHSGSVVTGLVVIAEVMSPIAEAPFCTFACTDGAGRGLPQHRVLGLIADVEQELLTLTILLRTAQADDE